MARRLGWTKIHFGAPEREGKALLSYVLAVLAACANAASSVLQRKANKEIPLVTRRPADACGAG